MVSSSLLTPPLPNVILNLSLIIPEQHPVSLSHNLLNIIKRKSLRYIGALPWGIS